MEPRQKFDSGPIQFRLPLEKQLNTSEQEARMILPGIQALFGFQLIAVFNQGFKTSLSPREQIAHLCALILVSLSALLVLSPAAYRRANCHLIGQHLVDLSSRFIGASMVPLAMGICLDLYLVSKIITDSLVCSVLIAGAVSLLFTYFWYVLPLMHRKRIHHERVQDLDPFAPHH